MFTDSANYISFNHVADCGFNTVRPGHRCCRHVCEVFGSDWSWDYKASIIKHSQSIWVDEVGAEVEWGVSATFQAVSSTSLTPMYPAADSLAAKKPEQTSNIAFPEHVRISPSRHQAPGLRNVRHPCDRTCRETQRQTRRAVGRAQQNRKKDVDSRGRDRATEEEAQDMKHALSGVVVWLQITNIML